MWYPFVVHTTIKLQWLGKQIWVKCLAQCLANSKCINKNISSSCFLLILALLFAVPIETPSPQRPPHSSPSFRSWWSLFSCSSWYLFVCLSHALCQTQSALNKSVELCRAPFENNGSTHSLKTGKILHGHFYTAFRLAADKPHPKVCYTQGLSVRPVQPL